MIPYAPLTQKQVDYILRCRDSWLNVAEGGKRAGKNVINLIAWAACLDVHPDKLHLAGGVSQSVAKINIIDSDGFGLEHIFDGRCRSGEYKGKAALFINSVVGNKVVIIAGGHDAGSAKMIKGHSFGTAYVTEANECHPLFFKEVMDRTLASHDRKLFFDLNPKPPAHWFYSDFLDGQDAKKTKGENPRYNYGHFTIADNMAVSNADLAEYLATYDHASIWYQCDIAGKRTSAAGRIYTSYDFKSVAMTREEILKEKYIEVALGVDVGGTAATAATLVGFTPGYQKVITMDGLYHKQGKESGMDEATYAELIVKFIYPWALMLPNFGTIYVDSAAKLFIQALKNALHRNGLSGRFNVRGIDKSDGILERIRLNCTLLTMGRYKIAAHLKEWHEAYQMAVWDAEKWADKEWVRVDDGSYPVDCLDSGEYAFYPFLRYLIY